ncbi:hypothetical protein FSP39_003683 [Pinctada imbricata]|uniref:B box-type domain-containing protein n=1 Tax=Pinctada imbricata TaxID=66713 RepID=A0AA88Y289_PINIB|nr:hypothetical protein FSP39_003683 [Pinctada imbricata]
MASSLYKAQCALRLCEKHDKKEINAYCKTCQEKVCSSCIKEDHNSHDWDMIADLLREKKHTLPEECKEIRATQLPYLRNEIDRLEDKIQEQDALFEQDKSAINETRKSYIDEINKLFNGRIDECRKNSEISKRKFKDERDGLKMKVEYLDMITTSLDKEITTLPNHDILDMEMEMRKELKKAFSYSADKDTCTTGFVPRKINVETMKKMIGEFHSVSVEELHDIGPYSESIQTIKPVSDTEAWMIREDNYPELIDRNGTQIKDIQTKCKDLIISEQGNIVLTSSRSRILILDQNGKKKITEFNTKPLRPTLISKTENDEILVTLREKGDDYNLLPTSRRVVQRMTLAGDVLNTYEFTEDGKTRLFTLPMTTAENKNNDVCIVNWISDVSGELVVLYKDGRQKFTYRGEGLNIENFLPTDVACDSKCNIIFSEAKNNFNAIHILGADGIFLCTLCQCGQFFPYVIAVYSDKIWCGFGQGRVKVYRYHIN